MPFGPSALGAVYFTGVKLAGYSAAGAYLNRRAATHHPTPLVFGAARTILGVAAGVTYGYILSRFSVSNTELAFYAGLVPVRIFEWLAIIWLFYRKNPQIAANRARYVAQGIGWSYVLDLPAVLAAFAIPGGFWIC
jgi:hypothetical protein